MTRTVEMVFALLCAGVAAVFGALASKAIRDGAHFLWYVLAGLGGIGTWTWMAKRSPWNLLVSAVLWDIVYNVLWIGTTIVWCKEAGSSGQIAGAIVVVIGLVIMNF